MLPFLPFLLLSTLRFTLFEFTGFFLLSLILLFAFDLSHVVPRRRSGSAPVYSGSRNHADRKRTRRPLFSHKPIERPAQPGVRFARVKPGGLLARGTKVETHEIEPGIGPKVPLQKEAAYGESNEPTEPVENPKSVNQKPTSLHHAPATPTIPT